MLDQFRSWLCLSQLFFYGHHPGDEQAPYGSVAWHFEGSPESDKAKYVNFTGVDFVGVVVEVPC